jgi:hypothetical protein
MEKKTYSDQDCDLEALCTQVESWFARQGYETQSTKRPGAYLIQARKTDTWRKVLGASRAFNCLIQGHSKEFSVEIGTGEWATNLTAGGVAAVLTGGATLIASGIVIAWSKKIEADLWEFIDNQVVIGEKVKS